MEQNKTTSASLSRLVEQADESSQKERLQCFFNHVLLGQWELARSTASLICRNPLKEDRKVVLNALIDVTANPYEQSIGSSSVTTPEQLSWLALQEYEHHTSSETQGSETFALKPDVEFRLLLVQECSGVDDSILHEVYQYFQRHHGTGQAYSQLATFDSRGSLPRTVADFVKQMLRSRPATGHHLISFLMPKKRMTDNRESEALQGLYLQSINALLDGLPADGAKRAEMCDKIFQLLSFYDPEPYWNYLQIRQLFTRLITLTKTDSSNFSRERVMEALMGRTQGYLMEELGKLLHEVDVSGIAEVLSDLSEEHKLTLHLLTGKDRDACWQRYFVSCLKWNKHCMGLIMETCISLVMTEQFETLGQFLAAPELRRLQPVVLLACWTYCYSSDSARHLLDTLWTSTGEGTHPALTAGCKKLAYQLSLIKWCLERARPLLESSESTPSQPTYGERATKLLHGLETHSVLFVLHRSTQLATLDSHEVLRLLQNVARNTGDREKKKQKSVHFQDDSQPSETKEPISAEQEHDICIYRSYCAVKNVMDALVFCFENSDLELMHPIRVKNVLKPRRLSTAMSTNRVASVSSSEGDESSTPSGGRSSGEGMESKSGAGQASGVSFEETYRRRVWQRIQQAREHLQHLYPLAYRVEILENIFSLLFCRHSDILDGALMIEGDSDDGVEGESRGGSTENLNMSIVSEEDAESEKLSSSLKDSPSTSSSLLHQTDSAFGSLGPEDKSQQSSSIDYDAPFQERKSFQMFRLKHSRVKCHDSSDNVKSASQPDYSCGFLANDYVVRDVLAMLKDALVDLNAVKFKMQGQLQGEGRQTQGASKQTLQSVTKSSTAAASAREQLPESKSRRNPNNRAAPSPDRLSKIGKSEEADFNPALEKLLSRTVSSSVTTETMQKRVAQLTQHIHEAQWRFQLVAHEQIPRQAGRVLEEVVTVTDDDNYAACLADEWMSSKRSQSAESVRAQSSKSGYRRSIGSVGTAGVGPVHPYQQSIITRMLSSPHSLLTMSLAKSNFAQAAQVIKLLKISEKTREAAEVAFTETFNATAKSISALNVTNRETHTPLSAKKFSMQALKSAAAAGVANATLSNFVDDLLSNPNIPPLPRPQWASEHGQDSAYDKLFSLDTTTAILLDLACTMCQSWELCNNIFNIIKAKGKLDKQMKDVDGGDADDFADQEASSPTDKKKGKNTSFHCKLKGCRSFFHQLDSLMQLGHGDSDHWTASAMQEVSAISSTLAAKGKAVPALVIPPSSAPHTALTVQQSLVQRFRSVSSLLTASVVRQYEGSLREIQQTFELANQALLASSHFDRQESINIDETHFAKSPAVQQSPASVSPATSRTSSIGSAGSLLSREMPGRMEIPLLHQRMKHLIAVMEKSVPHGGLFLFLVHGKMERGMLRNYLLSLYEHVKELAYVVAECESKSSETLILPKNYFSILQEGPVDILGRLMFVKRVSPGRLEKVASKLSLNLTHIIVQSCCPQIPSKHLPVLPAPSIQDVEKLGAKCVYNSGPCDNRPVSHPDVFVSNILKDILSAMEEISIRYNGKGIFTEQCGKQLVKSEHYTKMTSGVRNLQTADISLLDSRERRLCFFTNLMNLMTIHYHLHTIRLCLQAEERDGENRGEDMSWGLRGLEGRHLLDVVTKLGAFCYRVGQLGVLSLFELKYIMLHHGQNISNKWKSLVRNGGHKLAADDPMSVFMPPAEPRLLFVVSDGCLSSPPIQVLEPSKLSAQLDAAAKSYLQHAVRLLPESNQITLPLLLTSLSLDEPVKKHNSQTLFDNLLNFVSINAVVPQAQLLDQMTKMEEEREKGTQDSAAKSPSSPEVSLSDYCTDFGYVFKMEDVAVPDMESEENTDMPGSPRRMPGFHQQGAGRQSLFNSASLSAFLPQHFLLESCGSQMDGKVSMAEPASYQLTPVTLDYVRETSTLVATLLTLLCADELEDIETQFTDDHFQAASLPRHRASSDISVVDIRSYRYHRLVDDFPIMHRHLLTYIIPLAGADNPEISNSGEPILKFVTNIINEDVKMCLFSLHDSLQFLDMLHTMASRLTAKRQWQALLPVLRSIPEVVVNNYPHLQLLHDFIVSCWVREFSAALPKSKSPTAYATSRLNSIAVDENLLHHVRKMYCADAQARVVVAVCDQLPVDWGLDLLELCLSQSIPPAMHAVVASKHHCLSIFHRITSCIKTLQIKLSMQQSDFTLPKSAAPQAASQEFQKLLVKYEDWRRVAEMSRDDPKEVMSVLIQAGDFVVTRDWARMYQLPPDLMMYIEVWYVMSLLNANTSDTLPAYQALEDVRKARPGDCLEVCQLLLQKLEDQHKVQFLTNYMLQNLTATLPHDELEDLRLRRIGAKALLCIPVSMRKEYSHLVACPHLVLEQLLMNMKGELAGQVFEKIRDDFNEIKENKLRVAQDQFNTLLTIYARKALEVTVVQALDNRSSTVGSPRPGSAGSGSSWEEGRSTPSQRLAAEAVRVRKRNMDLSATSPKPGTTPPTSSTIQRRGSTLSVTAAPAVNTTTTKGNSTKFIMPALPPPEDQWVPDAETSVCMVCKLERFSMFNRRHHCRRCGRVVCAACSTKRSQVRGVPARTCDECYEQIFGTRESRARDEQEVYSQRMKESLSGASPNPNSSTFGQSPPRFRSSDLSHTRSLSSAVHHDVHEWKLKTDEGLNSYVRDEFYYEQAPSVSLCMSFIQHHADQNVCGQLILNMCDDLSSFLQPLAPGVPNQEVDYGLIISIIRELLFRAKMIFLKGGDSGMIAKCDAYQTRVDLLKILLEANYPDLPTLQELSKTDTARRLRDKLVKDERLQLALEVCTKCGVEATGVWLAWGRACLQCGDFVGARDKFAHCLKAPKDKNQIGGSSRLLMEIIDLLESLPPTGLTEIQMVLSSSTSLSAVLSVPIPAQQEETSVESVVYHECAHYLRTYGTYSDHLKFLLRNGYWNKALKFVVDRRCSTEVFVESILQPVLQAGDMTRLLEQLLMHDSSLDQWMPHLTASCRYLLKARRFHLLYNLQLFMKDFLRAAMTCITHFYQQGAQSYLDLANRLQFLFIAQEHMQAYLDPVKWGAVRHPAVSPITPPSSQGGHSPRQRDLVVGGGQSAAQLCMSKEEVTRHLRTIALQIEVTQFLEQCLGSRTGEAAAVATQFVAQAKSSTVIPTLFGNQDQRRDVVKMILLSGGKPQVGFELALRIFYECQLRAVAVLKRVVCEQLKQQHLQDMLELLQLSEQRRVLDDEEWDEVVSTALLEITEKRIEAREETETLIKMIRKEHNKINALIMTGKLRSAYLTAAKTNRVQDITRIMAAAERMGQAAVRNICKKWLEQHQRN